MRLSLFSLVRRRSVVKHMKSLLRQAAQIRLLKKKLGLRGLFDVIPLDASLVRGSHGRVPEDLDDWPVLAGDFPQLEGIPKISAVQVHHELLGAIRRGIAKGSAPQD